MRLYKNRSYSFDRTTLQIRQLNLMKLALNLTEQQSRLYLFPPIEQIPTTYSSEDQINRIMDLALKYHNEKCLPSNRIEKTMILKKSTSGVIYRCRERYCNAYVSFVKKGDNFQLSQYDPEHEHRVKSNRKGRLPKINNTEVDECHDELQLLNFKPREIVEFIRSKFKISTAHFYGIKFLRNKRQNIRNLLMSLCKYDHFFFECKDMRELVAHYKKQKFPDNVLRERDIILLVSRKMKQLYEGYHCQYIYFSTFTDIVLETRYSKTLQYHNIGILYGEDAAGSLNLLFGLVILKKSVRLAYLYVLEKLFSFLGKYPKVIITDYDQALAEAIKRLKERIKVEGAFRQHVQLPYTFLSNNNFQTKVSPQFTSSLGADLQNALRDSDYKSHQLKFKTILENNEIYNHYQSRQKVAEELQKYIRMNSIIHLQPLFIGLTLTPYSTYSLLKARVLDYFKSPRPMILAVKAFFQIFGIYPVLKFLSTEQINARLNPPKQSSVRIEKLHLLQTISKTLKQSTKMKQLSKALSSPAALYFYDTLEECYTAPGLDQIEASPTKYYYKVIENQTNYPYTIKKIKETVNGYPTILWRCDCKVYFKSGLPCWHELKTCLQEGADVTLQVNPYWVVDSKPLQSRPNQPATEHDIKNWHDTESHHLSVEDGQPQNLSQVVNITSNEHPKKYFDYSEKDMRQNQEIRSETGIGQIIESLGVLQWQINDSNQQNYLKKEENYNLPEISSQANTSFMEGLIKLQDENIISNKDSLQDDPQMKYIENEKNGEDQNEFYFQNSELNSQNFREQNQVKEQQVEISLDLDELEF